MSNGRQKRERTEIRQAGKEVGNDEARWTVETIGSLLDERGTVLEEGGHVGDRHKRHEGRAKELEGVSRYFLISVHLAAGLQSH